MTKEGEPLIIKILWSCCVGCAVVGTAIWYKINKQQNKERNKS